MTRFAALWILMLAVPLCAAPAERDTPDYYPLKAGTTWEYKVITAQGTGTVTNTIAKIEKIDGKPLARLECEARGQVVASEHLTSTDKGIFRHRFNGIDFSPPVCLVKLPVKEGETWETEVKAGKATNKIACKVMGNEEVTVGSGKYKALKTSVEVEENGQKVLSTYWFAANVGIVKQVIEIGPTKYTMELEKFKMGK